jgi:hypothetical protein
MFMMSSSFAGFNDDRARRAALAHLARLASDVDFEALSLERATCGAARTPYQNIYNACRQVVAGCQLAVSPAGRRNLNGMAQALIPPSMVSG